MSTTRRSLLLLALLGALLALATAAGSAAAATFTVTNLPLVPVEGQAYAGAVATFTAPGGPHTASEFPATIEWGDGLTQTGIVTGAGEEFTVSTEGHTFAEEGAYALTVTVKEQPGVIVLAEASDATTLAVADASLLTAPFAAPTVFSGAGPSTSATLSAFEAGIGGTDNGVKAGEQSGGLRHINWDGVALDGSQPETLVIDPGHTVAVLSGSQQDRGVQLDSPIAVSGDGFASVNPGVTALFGSFSAANIAAPFNTNVFALHIVAPTPSGASPLPAATSAFGVTFLNVILANTTSVEYLNGETVLAKLFAPVSGHERPSFVGALFNTPAITGVRITLGTARIFSFNGTTFTAGPFSESPPNNLVAADDLLLAEPVPVPDRLTLTATAGAAFSGALASFQDANPNASSHDSLATVDWGDGSSSRGVIAANASGGFSVSGTHTYAQAGTMPVSVAVGDLGGAHTTLHATIVVSPAAVIVSPPPIATPPGTPPASPPAPQCKLSVGSATLARMHLGAGAFAAAARVRHRKTVPHNRLRATANCDQDAAVTLTATATIAGGGRHGHKARATLRSLALGYVSANLTANHPATLSLTLSSSALAKLRTAVSRHESISVKLTLAASSAHGTATATAGVASLKL
ncbi:MAG TPA: hypothetical protein VGY76_03510 [Solirubrobacteraceae bacterium]|jgi:hypothetical protein|nr:hypothetical protein [Solirubrobacteraceae bacterium]